MKNLIQLGLILIILLNTPFSSHSQDSLSNTNLSELSHSFKLGEGKLIGEGADLLFEKMANAQFTLLGEFHGSKNISELTEVLIPKLHKWGYDHLVLEVGPHTGEFFNQLPTNKKETISRIRQLNQKYLRKDEDEISYPIPFFDKVEDAEFLGEAKALNWNIIGIDQEYLDAFQLQIDWMFDNLSQDQKEIHSAKYQIVMDTLKEMYMEMDRDGIRIYSSIIKSTIIQDFLNQMDTYLENKSLVEDFRKSIEIYHMNSTGQWYENNGTRIKYMKKKLREGLSKSDFDISKDKLLIKMGGYHMSQGFSPLGFYEVGNMLNELAEFHGNTALNVGFINRYYHEENSVNDALAKPSFKEAKLSHFYGMGSRDEWIVIDLIPIRKGFYYHPQKYLLNKYEENLIQRFDILIITPTEYEGNNNF